MSEKLYSMAHAANAEGQLQAVASGPLSNIIVVIERLIADYGDSILGALPGLLAAAGVPAMMVPLCVAIAGWLVHIAPKPAA